MMEEVIVGGMEWLGSVELMSVLDEGRSIEDDE